MAGNHDGGEQPTDATKKPLMLLTHGVSGTTSETILDSPRVVAVPGTLGSDYRGEFTTYPKAPRHIERTQDRFGYRWATMTSGLRSQAIWALFAPFVMANVAIWMLPPVKRRPDGSACAGWTLAMGLARALFRLVGLALTAILVTQITYLVAEVLANQCRRTDDGGPRCWAWLADDWGWRWHAVNLGMQDGQMRSVVVVLILAAVFVLGAFVSLRGDNDSDLRTEKPGSANDALSSAPPIARDEFVRPTDSRATLLLTTHAVTGITLVGWNLVGGWHAGWWVTMGFGVVLIIAVCATALCNDPRASGGDAHLGGPTSRLRWMWRLFVSWFALGWMALGALTLFVIMVWVLPNRFRGAGDGTRQVIDGSMLDWLFFAAALLVAAAAFMTVVVSLPFRKAMMREPRITRVWLWGMHAPSVAALAVLVGAGAGVALTRLVIGVVVVTSDEAAPRNVFDQTIGWLGGLIGAHNLRETSMTLPRVYMSTAWMWGATTMVCATIVLVVVGIALFRKSPRQTLAIALQARVTPEKIPTIRWKLATGKLATPTALAIVTTVAVAAGAVARFCHSLVSATEWIETVGTLALVAFAGLILRAVYNAAKSPRNAGRALGVLWDLGSFWPREAHPLVPPAYAPRAIRDLEKFVTTTIPKVLPDDENAPLVLGGHSQGSLIMYALAHRLHALGVPAERKLSLLTYGSQLGWAYGRAFPSVLNHDTHEQLRSALEDRWINLVRFTDYIGDGVVAVAGRDGFRPYMQGSVTGDLNPQPQCGAAGSVSASVPRYVLRREIAPLEVWLPDPSPGDYPADTIHQHSAYTSDVTWDEWIEALTPAGRVTATPQPARGTTKPWCDRHLVAAVMFCAWARWLRRR